MNNNEMMMSLIKIIPIVNRMYACVRMRVVFVSRCVSFTGCFLTLWEAAIAVVLDCIGATIKNRTLRISTKPRYKRFSSYVTLF